MVFSSVPVYLDPHNWQQQPNHHQGGGGENPQFPPSSLPPQAGGGAGLIRPGSMTDRARLAKLPQPEAGLKCPRCESTNTKFCYFNNYSLTQPRHFCKTCRRYWTRGGALRNVPVGGGCRRNKRSKSRTSKSPVTAEGQKGPNSSSAIPSSNEMAGHFPQLPLMTSLQNLTQYGVGNIGLNFGGAGQSDMGLQRGNNSSGSSAILGAGGADQWRSQHFPFLASFEPTSALYQFQSEGVEAPSSLVGDSQSQPAPVKMEENQRLNLSRQFMGISENNQFWGGNTFTDFSGLNSSTTSHLL
ncbi:hypothetical protein L1049_013088 [Liquidambar formosana]|uniref:Dof zinc finger protein n=1 Tax=Liquidambar formosana TaxID=63359 RepID=A0AAP0RML0_LIQFO